MERKIQYEIISATKEQGDRIEAYLQHLDKVTAEIHQRITDRLNVQENQMHQWCKNRDKRDDAAIADTVRYRKKVDAASSRHMKAVEKFLALIAKRIK